MSNTAKYALVIFLVTLVVGSFVCSSEIRRARLSLNKGADPEQVKKKINILMIISVVILLLMVTVSVIILTQYMDI